MSNVTRPAVEALPHFRDMGRTWTCFGSTPIFFAQAVTSALKMSLPTVASNGLLLHQIVQGLQQVEPFHRVGLAPGGDHNVE